MPKETVRVKGYREFLRACDHAGKDSKREVRSSFRRVGEIVRVEASSLFDQYDPHSAAGYRVSVRQKGVAVQQSLRRTTGLRADYGSLQMRKALLPALRRRETEVVREMENALDRVGDQFERSS